MRQQETEIKLPVRNPSRISSRLRSMGAQLHHRKHFEDNFVLDYPDRRLRDSGSLLRVRVTRQGAQLTFKGPARVRQRMKIRRELETRVPDGTTLLAILGKLGLRTTFRYQKFRTEYRLGTLHVTLDETPIGHFMEIEGPPRRIASLAKKLGFESASFISDTYYDLFLFYRKGSGKRVKGMVFHDR